MKDKRVLIIAACLVAVCTLALVLFVNGSEKLRVTNVETVVEDAGPSPAVWLEKTEPPAQAAPSRPPQTAVLPIAAAPLPRVEIKPEEAVLHNWVCAEPGPADLTEKEAIENACLVTAALFDIPDSPGYSTAFEKDMTGQRANIWRIGFADDGLRILLDAITGNVYSAAAHDRWLRGERFENPEDGTESQAIADEIIQQLHDGTSPYLTQTKRLVEDYLANGREIEDIVLNSIGGTGDRYPVVSMMVRMVAGDCYDIHWIKDKWSGGILLVELSVFRDWEACLGWSYWKADQIYNDYEKTLQLDAAAGPAVERIPTPYPQPTLTPKAAD